MTALAAFSQAGVTQRALACATAIPSSLKCICQRFIDWLRMEVSGFGLSLVAKLAMENPSIIKTTLMAISNRRSGVSSSRRRSTAAGESDRWHGQDKYEDEKHREVCVLAFTAHAVRFCLSSRYGHFRRQTYAVSIWASSAVSNSRGLA